MYAMYEWNEPGAAATDAPARSERCVSPGGRSPGTPDYELSAALQFALDRRDNGGDAAR